MLTDVKIRNAKSTATRFELSDRNRIGIASDFVLFSSAIDSQVLPDDRRCMFRIDSLSSLSAS